MPDSELISLNITIKRAASPEKLSELLTAALAQQETLTRVVVPTGYRCQECFAGDGGHESGCSMILLSKAAGAGTNLRDAGGGEAQDDGQGIAASST